MDTISTPDKDEYDTTLEKLINLLSDPGITEIEKTNMLNKILSLMPQDYNISCSEIRAYLTEALGANVFPKPVWLLSVIREASAQFFRESKSSEDLRLNNNQY